MMDTYFLHIPKNCGWKHIIWDELISIGSINMDDFYSIYTNKEIRNELINKHMKDKEFPILEYFNDMDINYALVIIDKKQSSTFCIHLVLDDTAAVAYKMWKNP
jgi:hypothetical protein